MADPALVEIGRLVKKGAWKMAIKKGVKAMVDEAMAEIKTITVDEAIAVGCVALRDESAGHGEICKVQALRVHPELVERIDFLIPEAPDHVAPLYQESGQFLSGFPVREAP